MVTRRDFLASTAALAANSLVDPLVAQDRPEASAGRTKPNILVFMPDQQQGPTVLPDHPCLTPNIDKFARQGLIFPNAFCPAPHCCPSRASFMTGLYPSEHGVFNNVDTDTAIHANPYPGTKFFSQSLRSGGYDLAYAGKWHVGRDLMPQDVGWTNLTPARAPGEVFTPGQERRDSNWAKAKAELQRTGPRKSGEVIRPGWGNIELYGSIVPKGPKGYEGLRDYEIVKTGVEGLHRLAGGGKPWCLMVSNSGGHDLYRAPQNFLDMYDPKSIVLPENFRDTLEDKPRIYQRMRYQYWSQLSDDEVRQSIAHYWAKLTMQDALFGLLLEALEATGQADNTLVAYVSDHGDYAAAHGLWAKGVPSFREGYNIPCVLRWPKGIANPGRQVDAFVSTTDFAPTFLEAAGISGPPMSGRSLLPWLRGETPSGWRDAVFSQLNGVELYYTQRIVMTKDFKYVYNGFDYDELYDRVKDPHEMVNLAFPDLKQSRAMVEQGTGLQAEGNLPWPPLDSSLAEVRRDMLERMWRFAQEHKDQIFNPYITVAMAPYGPGVEL